MKIERHYLNPESLSKFADRHGLVMEVRERADKNLPRFYASFKDVEVKEGPILVGTYGDGPTESAAIKDYADLISHKMLAVNACSTGRRTLVAPKLEYLEDGE